MEKTIREHAAPAAPAVPIETLFADDDIVPLEEQHPAGFNVNKLQAALCMLASALVSIGLIVWLIAG